MTQQQQPTTDEKRTALEAAGYVFEYQRYGSSGVEVMKTSDGKEYNTTDESDSE